MLTQSYKLMFFLIYLFNVVLHIVEFIEHTGAIIHLQFSYTRFRKLLLLMVHHAENFRIYLLQVTVNTKKVTNVYVSTCKGLSTTFGAQDAKLVWVPDAYSML